MTQETLDCLVHNLNEAGMFCLFVGSLVLAIGAAVGIGGLLSHVSDQYDDLRSWLYPVLIVAGLILSGTIIYTLATC